MINTILVTAIIYLIGYFMVFYVNIILFLFKNSIITKEDVKFSYSISFLSWMYLIAFCIIYLICIIKDCFVFVKKIARRKKKCYNEL